MAVLEDEYSEFLSDYSPTGIELACALTVYAKSTEAICILLLVNGAGKEINV